MKKGFTLAEVLITLGIIGVVAAMTIPTLVANYNERVWRTGAEVFNRKLEEALKTMNTQQTLAGHTTTESFVEELSKHFKTNKICQNDELLDCFSDVVYWGGGDATPEEVDMSKVKTAKHFGQNDWNTNIVGVQFANGVSALIAYNPTTGDKACTQDPYSNQVTGGDCLAILYDTSANKNPNTSGKDLRSNGNVNKLGLNCYMEINGLCIIKPAQTITPHYWNACQSDGTSSDAEDLEFMSKYGIQSCCSYVSCASAGDSWAGAAQICEGAANLPQRAELEQIIAYIYNGGRTYDNNKASELGLPYSPSRTFIWGTETSNTMSADVRVMSSNYQWEGTSRNGESGFYALCVE